MKIQVTSLYALWKIKCCKTEKGRRKLNEVSDVPNEKCWQHKRQS